MKSSCDHRSQQKYRLRLLFVLTAQTCVGMSTSIFFCWCVISLLTAFRFNRAKHFGMPGTSRDQTNNTKNKKKTLLERGNKASLIREALRCCRSFEVVATKEQFDTPLKTSSAQGNPTRRTNPETPSKNRSTTGKRKVSIGKTKNSITCPRQMLSELAFRSEQDLRHKQNTTNIKCLFDRS